MAEYLGVDISKIVNDGLGPLVKDASLRVISPGSRTPGSLAAGTNPTTASKTAKGFVKDYSEFQMASTLVQRGDRNVVLLADSIADAAEPKTGDEVLIEGDIYNIINVAPRDPASATFECQARGKS